MLRKKGKEPHHLGNSRGSVSIEKTDKRCPGCRKAGDHTASFTKPVIECQAPDQKVCSCAGYLFDNLRCCISPIADNDQLSVESADGIEERPDTVLLVISRNDEAAGKLGCGVHGNGGPDVIRVVRGQIHTEIRAVCPLPFFWSTDPGTGISSTFRPSSPITLLVFAEVLGEHGPGPVFLRHRERGGAKRLVFSKAACRRRAFPEDRGGVLGYLDELGCDNGIEPDKVGKHLFCLCILHTDEVIRGSILRCGKRVK